MANWLKIDGSGFSGFTLTSNNAFWGDSKILSHTGYGVPLTSWKLADSKCACGMEAVFRSPQDFCKTCWVAWFVQRASNVKYMNAKQTHFLFLKTLEALMK